MEIINNNSIFCNSSKLMRNYCTKLFKDTPVTYFEYVRIYADGLAIKLDTKNEILNYILTNNLYLKPEDISDFKHYSLMSLAFPKAKSNAVIETLSVYKTKFNLGNFFLLTIDISTM